LALRASHLSAILADVSEKPPPPLNTFHDLPEVVISALPEPRRTLHRTAVELIVQNAATGTPFVLMLRTFGVAQLFVTADNVPGRPLENLVQDGLKDTGIDVIQVQVGGGRATSELYQAAIRREMQVHAPSLWMADEVWLENVTYLLHRAECIIVLLSLATPGVLEELDTIVAAGRADRTVVLVTAEDIGTVDRTVVMIDGEVLPDTTEVMEMPNLLAFPRVLWVGDVARPDVLHTFVFADLIERLKAIKAKAGPERRNSIEAGTLDRELPVTWKGIREGYERLAIESRAGKRSHLAAQYFGTAASIAMQDEDVTGAIEATIAQLALLRIVSRQPKAIIVGAEFLKVLQPAVANRWDHDADVVLGYARFVAEYTNVLIPDNLGLAEQLVAATWQRCRQPLNRRALSTLATASAWLLRQGDDVDRVLATANQAFELALSQHAPREMARALTVVGATLDDAHDYVAAEATLRRAAAIVPDGEDYLGAWLVRIRLATLLKHMGRLDDARAALTEAMRIAEAGSYGTWAGEAEYQRSQLDGKSPGS
jgi:tetratricopeptide (TPR) repeat protein